MRVLVVGAYGFIGRAVVGELLERGHDVVGLGRSVRIGKRVVPGIEWIEGDLNAMGRSVSWRPLLHGIDAVINASGALQDGGRDRLIRIQADAIIALIDACVERRAVRFVQISAPGATRGADTAFLRTKSTADSHLVASPLAWTILRPALVVARDAYGGTALIRMLAALPVRLTVHGPQPIQCVPRSAVAVAAADAAEGRTPTGCDVDLAERETRALGEVVALHRRALGLPPAWAAFDMPATWARPIGWVADWLGMLGWRSPLRSTALAIVANGVVANGSAADPLGWRIDPLPEVLERLGLGIQDRWSARLGLLLPLIVASLSLLWIASGLAGLLAPARAAALIGGGTAAHMLVLTCAAFDLIVGLAILWRPWARRAAFVMAAMASGYLIGGGLLLPDLWADPLMPLLKTLPTIVLALVAAALLEER